MYEKANATIIDTWNDEMSLNRDGLFALPKKFQKKSL